MPRSVQPKVDNSLLEMAIVGYEAQLAKVAAQIAEIKAQLGQRGPGRPKGSAAAGNVAAPRKHRSISKAGRERIAAAQRARWAAQKKQQAAPQPKKRKMSAAGLKAIREATKKRWETYRKEHGTAA